MAKKTYPNLKKLIKKNATLLVVVSLALVLGVSVMASGSLYEDVVERIADKFLAGIEDKSFGVITIDKSRFQHGIKITGEGLDITGGGISVTGGEVSLGNQTTTIDRLDSIDIPLNLRTATSEGGSSAPHTVTVIGSLQNTGSDLICDTQGTLIDIYTANGLFAYGLGMGTSTSATSTESHLIDEDADNNEIGTTTTDILTKTDDEGSETEESWVWNNGEYVVITRTTQTCNATSSNSFTTAGGNRGEATAHLNCRSRY